MGENKMESYISISNNEWKAAERDVGERVIDLDGFTTYSLELDEQMGDEINAYFGKEGVLVSAKIDLSLLSDDDKRNLCNYLNPYHKHGVYTNTWGFVDDEFIKRNIESLFQQLHIQRERELREAKRDLKKAGLFTRPAKIRELIKRVEEAEERHLAEKDDYWVLVKRHIEILTGEENE